MVRFTATTPGAATFIDLVAPSVEEIVLNGVRLDNSVFADSRIALADLAAENELRVVADCAYTNTGEGLHLFVDPVDGETYLYTQFEVPDARRVFASFEQPDLKAAFTFTVTAPAGWVVVSNSPAPEPEGEGDTRVWRFAPTGRISSYITALVAGPYVGVFDSYENGEQKVPLGIYCGPRCASSWTPRRSSRSPSRASTTSRRSSTSPTRSPSTTSCSCRSSTPARWRTRAPSPCATSTCSGPR